MKKSAWTAELQLMKYDVLRSTRFRFFRNCPDYSWYVAGGALRILTPDTKPVYAESESCPGGFVVTSHSGITLAPLYASTIPSWIIEGKTPEGFEQFHPRRFDA